MIAVDECTLDNLMSKVSTLLHDLARFSQSLKRQSIHLAILQEPYLSFIINGRKTIESRFSKNKIIPYKSVLPGDIILLKRSSGNVEAACTVKNTWFFKMDAQTVDRIRDEFGKALCIDDESYWKDKIAKSSYGSLLEIENVVKIEPFKVSKADRRPWVILKRGVQSSLLDVK